MTNKMKRKILQINFTLNINLIRQLLIALFVVYLEKIEISYLCQNLCVSHANIYVREAHAAQALCFLFFNFVSLCL